MSITRKEEKILSAGLLGLAALMIAYTVSPASAQPAPGCRATQPVYTSDYKPVGSWEATLTPGDEVNLPDGDVATCLRDRQGNSQLDIEQP